MEAPLYKVLLAGQSCNNGNHKWSLPTRGADGEWTPGAWHEIPAPQKLIACSVGFHLTTDPRKWWDEGKSVYLAETVGERTNFIGDKVAVRKVRLTRRVTAADVAADLGVHITRGALSDEMVYGSGYGYGYGYGYGDGYGYGYGDGYGSGSGHGYDIVTQKAA